MFLATVLEYFIPILCAMLQVTLRYYYVKFADNVAMQCYRDVSCNVFKIFHKKVVCNVTRDVTLILLSNVCR